MNIKKLGFSRLKGRLLYILLPIILLILLISGLLFTYGGNQLIISGLKLIVPSLTIDLEQGSFFFSPKYKQISWIDNNFLNLEIKNINYTFDWSCLPTSMCIKSLTSSGTSITLFKRKKDLSTIKKVKNKLFHLALPLPIKIEKLSLQNTHFEMQNVVIVDLKSINLSASGNGEDVVTNSTANGLTVILEEKAKAKTKTPIKTTANHHNLSPVNKHTFPAILKNSSLVDVVLPLELNVHKFILNNFLLENGNVPILSLNKIETGFSFKKSLVNISHLKVDFNELNLDLSGQINLVKRYPFTVSANGIIKNVDQLKPTNLLKGVTYNFKGEGDLSKIKTKITLIAPRIIPQSTLTAWTTIDLFTDNIPYDLKLDWKNLRWPLRGNLQVSSRKGHLYSKGNFDNYKIKAQTNYHVHNIPKGNLYLACKGDLNKINLDSLLVKTLNGNIKLTGKLGWKNSIHWSGLLAVNKIDLSQLNKRYHGVFSGKIKQTATVQISHNNKLRAWKFGLPMINISGKYLKRPFLIDGQVSGNNKTGINVSDLVINNASNNIIINGRIAKNANLKVNVIINDFSQAVLGSTGKMTGAIFIKGPQKALNISTNFMAKDLSYKEDKLKSLHISSDLILVDKPILKASVIANNLVMAGQTVDTIKLAVKESKMTNSNTRKHIINLAVKSKIASTNLTVDVRQTKKAWLAFINSASFFVPKESISLDEPFQIKLTKNNNISLSKHCWSTFDAKNKKSGSVCLNKFNVGKEGDIKFNIHNYLLVSLNPFLPKMFNLNGSISSDANIHWKKNKYPIINVNIESDNMAITINAGKKKQTTFPVKTFAINLKANKNIDLDVNVLSDHLINAKIKTIIYPYKNKYHLNGKIQLIVPNLSPFGPLIKQIKTLSGSINSSLIIYGPIKKPMANGIINLNDIRLESEVLPLRIKKLNAKVIVHGTHAQFKGLLSTGYNISTIPKNDAPRENILTKSLVFIDKSIKKSIYVITNSGHKKSLPKLTAIAPGTAEIQGYFDWKKHYKGRLDLIANKIELYEYGKIDLLVTPKITLHIGKELNLSGYIYIDQGRIKIKEIPEGAIAVSEDVVVVDEKRKTISTMLPLKIALKLDLGKNLKIDAFGLQSNLEGLLRINKQKRQDINLHGELRIVSGSYRALGQRLILRNSRMNFTGPPESPYISIEAIRPPEKTKDGVIAGVRVTGLPDDLKLVIFADPAKTQQNAISYITTGKSIENSSGTSNSQIATLLIGIGAGQTSGVLNNAGNTVGISDLSISSKGYGVEQSIGLSGYILPGVQVSYGVGIFDSFNIVAINYEVFKNFYIEVSSGLNQAIDAYYNFELD